MLLRAVTKCLPPLHHYPTSQRQGAWVPFPRPTLHAKGLLTRRVPGPRHPSLHSLVSGSIYHPAG